jgi:aspartate racemase
MSTGKTVGVLGGMGPEATVDFMAKVIALTPADKDQDHIQMLVDHNPTVPNRQAAILGEGEDPGPVLADMARRLESAGADFLVIPCNTAYGFRDSVENAVDIPLVSIIDVTIDAVGELAPGARSVGLLATDGCLQASVYQNAMKANDLVPVLLDDVEMEKFMTLVNGIKAGYKGEVVANSMHQLANALIDRGAEVIIAGCTEVPLVLENSKLGVPLASSTDVLAQKTVQLAKPE